MAFRHNWEKLINSHWLSYIALLRNLRKILEINVSSTHLRNVCQTLYDPKAEQKVSLLLYIFLLT
ncbi:TROVE domain-containing protein [Rufibacter glacialis]|uniref:TROVE domain-containing protein n=1 Tax=Rufibacter glacialis TaxID=1259555 RepID=A0A5M8QIS0_9BACT|nr:TROVE domain-containing protein [Rufibacter glacialis]